MSLEQKLRLNLKAAANALTVPEPDPAPSPSQPRSWHGLGVAAIGAAAVVALALPALVFWSGEASGEDAATPTTAQETFASSGTEDSPTTVVPSTALPTPEQVTLGDTTVDDYRLVLTAIRGGEEEPPTATVTLGAIRIGTTTPADQLVVGPAGGFFWNVLTGSNAVCDLTAESTTNGAEATVQILQSPSLGCSDTYSFDLVSGELSPTELAPDEVARQFVAAWRFGEGEMVPRLAEPEAVRQTDVLDTPVEPVFSYCEGAAGSAYCTFEVEGGELVVRVRSKQPAKVIELNFVAD